MTELSAAALAHLQTAASAGLVVCLLLAGAFATLGFVASGEHDRREAAMQVERQERIAELLRENDEVRATRTAGPETSPVQVAEVERAQPPGPLPTATEPPARAEEVREGEALAPVLAEAAPVPGEPEPRVAERAPADLFGAATPLPELPEEAREILFPPPRRLAEGEANAIAAALVEQVGTFSVEVVTAPEAEARLYALQLTGALRGAGIDARGPVTVLTTMQTDGVLVSTEQGADGPGATLLSVFQGAGLSAAPPEPNSEQSDIMLPDGTDVRVYVGGLRSKPTLAPPPERGEAPAEPRVLEDA